MHVPANAIVIWLRAVAVAALIDRDASRALSAECSDGLLPDVGDAAQPVQKDGISAGARPLERAKRTGAELVGRFVRRVAHRAERSASSGFGESVAGRIACGYPCCRATFDVEERDVFDAGRRCEFGCEGAALAGLANEEDILVARIIADLLGLVDDGVDRDQAYALRMDFHILIGLADIDHDGLSAVEHLLCFGYGDTGKRLSRIFGGHWLLQLSLREVRVVQA